MISSHFYTPLVENFPMQHYPRFQPSGQKFDSLSILLGLLMFFLIAMLYYFIAFTRHVEKSIAIQQYVHHLHSIQTDLRRLKPFDYNFLNFDTLNSDLENFTTNLEMLKKNLDSLSNPPSYLYNAYDQILKAYEAYEVRIENFKSIYASTQNSLYQLRLLQEAIIKNDALPSDFRLKIANFGLKLLDLPRFEYDKNHFKNLQNELKELDLYSRAYDDEYTLRFTMHVNAVLNFIQWFDSDSANLADINLTNALNSFYGLTTDYYQKNLNFRHWLTVIFFVAACLLLGLIALVYRRTILSRKALQAFRYAIENSDNTIVITSPSREIVYANSAFEKSKCYLIN